MCVLTCTLNTAKPCAELTSLMQLRESKYHLLFWFFAAAAAEL